MNRDRCVECDVDIYRGWVGDEQAQVEVATSDDGEFTWVNGHFARITPRTFPHVESPHTIPEALVGDALRYGDHKVRCSKALAPRVDPSKQKTQRTRVFNRDGK